MNLNIQALDQKASCHEIYDLFQLAYKVEANLVKVEKFPPLLWQPEDIQKRRGDFWGIYQNSKLIACAQVFQKSGSEVQIHSLVVHPNHFRKGLGASLVDFVLNHYLYGAIYVETAAVNTPAILLYEKKCFKIIDTYVADLSIEKVRLILDRSHS